MATQSVRHGPHRAAPRSGLRSSAIQTRQPKMGEAEPPAEPCDCRFSKKPDFIREKRAFPSKRNTPTGNAARLSIDGHSLASDAWSFLPCSRCPSLQLLGSDSQQSIEPLAEPSADRSKKRLHRLLFGGDASKTTVICLLYLMGFFFLILLHPNDTQSQSHHREQECLFLIIFIPLKATHNPTQTSRKCLTEGYGFGIFRSTGDDLCRSLKN
jgi:hypothetical protein